MRLTSLTATLSFLAVSFALAAGGGTSVNSGVAGASSGQTNFKIVPLKNYILENNLPPEIRATFDLGCNQSFVQLIRNDVVDAETREVFIILGALVAEDSSDRCEGSFEVKASAGNAFSGRKHEIMSVE